MRNCELHQMEGLALVEDGFTSFHWIKTWKQNSKTLKVSTTQII